MLCSSKAFHYNRIQDKHELAILRTALSSSVFEALMACLEVSSVCFFPIRQALSHYLYLPEFRYANNKGKDAAESIIKKNTLGKPVRLRL